MLCVPLWSLPRNLRGRRRKLIRRRLILVSFFSFLLLSHFTFLPLSFPLFDFFFAFVGADIGVKSPELVVPEVAVGYASDVPVTESQTGTPQTI